MPRTRSWYTNAASLEVRPGGVEDRLIGVVHAPQFLGHEVIGFVPVDGPVVGSAFIEEHRVGDPALLAQPEVIAGLELGNGVLGEELRGDPATGGFLGHCLGAVLAELCRIALLMLRPGASHAVEPVQLVHRQQGLDAAQRPHLFQRNFQGVGNSGDAHGLGLGFGDGQL